MRGYFSQRYSSDNITVAAAGRLDFARLVDEVARLTSAWRPTGAARRYDTPQPAPGALSLTDAKLNRHYLSVMCPAPTAQDPRRYAAGILTDVLGDVDGSRLYWSLIDPGLADEAEFSHYGQDQVGSYFAFASCDPDRAAQVEQILLDTIDRYAASIDPAEIARAQNKIATQATLRGENPRGRMSNLGSQWVYLGEYLPLEEELRRIMAVTPDDIRALVHELPFQPRTIVRLGPQG
jgi:predicted Zn-dependent peptidase